MSKAELSELDGDGGGATFEGGCSIASPCAGGGTLGGVALPPPGSLEEGRQSPLGIQSPPGRPGSHGIHLGPKGIQPPVGEKTRCEVDDGDLLLSFTVDGGCSIAPGVVGELPLGGASTIGPFGRMLSGLSLGGVVVGCCISNVIFSRGVQWLGGLVLSQVVQ